MSSRDGSSLSDHERAILDRLAAKAEADDPSFAATLRARRRSITWRMPRVPGWIRHWSGGVVVGAAGMVMVFVSLGASLALGVVGVLLVFAGTAQVVTGAPWLHRGRRDGPGTPPES